MTHIKIGDVSPRVQYTADGTQTEFSYTFPLFTATDMEVYIDTEKQTTGYSVSGAGDTEGGSVTFTTAPAANSIITLYRKLNIERTSDFQEGGAFRADVINTELDYQVALVQQLSEKLDRSITLDVTATDSTTGLISALLSARDDAVAAQAQIALDYATISAWAEEAANVASLTDASSSTAGIIKLATAAEVTAGTDTGKAITPALLAGALAGKQENLVSGTNIKTVNSTSLLGSGDITVSSPDAATDTRGIVKCSTETAAPLPQASAGIGQIQAVAGSLYGSTTIFTLPAGGTWTYFFGGQWTTSYSVVGATGIAAGGSTISLSGKLGNGDTYMRMLCWRIA